MRNAVEKDSLLLLLVSATHFAKSNLSAVRRLMRALLSSLLATAVEPPMSIRN